MRTLQVFDKGEKVMIEMEIGGVRFVGGNPVYELKDPRTDRFYDYKFKNEQLIPVPAESEDGEAQGVENGELATQP